MVTTIRINIGITPDAKYIFARHGRTVSDQKCTAVHFLIEQLVSLFPGQISKIPPAIYRWQQFRACRQLNYRMENDEKSFNCLLDLQVGDNRRANLTGICRFDQSRQEPFCQIFAVNIAQNSDTIPNCVISQNLQREAQN